MDKDAGGLNAVKGEIKARNTLLIVFVIAAAAIASAAFLLGGYIERSGIPTVEFANTVPSPGDGSEDKRPVLRVAVAAMISPEMTKKHYDELLRLVGDKLGMRVVFMQRRTYAEVNALVHDKGVDAAFVCSGPYVNGRDEFGMEIIAVPVVRGEKVYYSYIIVNADSGYSSLAELKGKRFAFTDPDSNTGCLVPRYMLAQIGETPQSFFSETFYTHSHDNSISAVADGRADGAAVDSLIWEFLKDVEPEKTAGTKVVEKSPPYGIPPVVVNPEIDPGLKIRLRDAFLHLHEDEKGRALLEHLKIDRFDHGDERAYEEVRKMQKWVSAQGR